MGRGDNQVVCDSFLDRRTIVAANTASGRLRRTKHDMKATRFRKGNCQLLHDCMTSGMCNGARYAYFSDSSQRYTGQRYTAKALIVIDRSL